MKLRPRGLRYLGQQRPRVRRQRVRVCQDRGRDQKLGLRQRPYASARTQVVDRGKQAVGVVHVAGIDPIQVVHQLDQCQHQRLECPTAIVGRHLRQVLTQCLHLFGQARGSSQLDRREDAPYLAEQRVDLAEIRLLGVGPALDITLQLAPHPP